MTQNINIPPEAVEAGLRAFTGSACDCNSCRKAVIRTIRAAMEAWPGVGNAAIPHWPGPHQEIEQRPSIILPLPEPRDD